MSSAKQLTAESVPFGVRKAAEDDLPFILNSWVRSQRHVGSNALMSSDDYHRTARARAEARLLAGEAIVAHNIEDPWHIFGWCVYAPDEKAVVVHGIYVKYPFRRLGIARRLVEDANPHGLALVATSLPASAAISLQARGIIYDPWR